MMSKMSEMGRHIRCPVVGRPSMKTSTQLSRRRLRPIPKAIRMMTVTRSEAGHATQEVSNYIHTWPKCSNTPTGWSQPAPHLELIFIKLLQEIWHHLGTRCCSWLRQWTSHCVSIPGRSILAGQFWLGHRFSAFPTLAGWRRSVHKCSLPKLQIQFIETFKQTRDEE
jgi:hypothetical protein